MTYQKKDIIALSLLFILAFWLWTLPLQTNSLPFGEGDAAYHFAYSDYMTQTDKSMGFSGLPTFIGFMYYGWNKIGPMTLEYPPTYHLGVSLAQIFGGDRTVSPFLYIAITSILGIFAMYFLIRKLFGFNIAFATSFWLVFELRAILGYLWGQRPNVVAFAYIPIAVYTLYVYMESYYEDKNPKQEYLYLFSLISAGAYLTHLSAFLLIAIIAAVFVTALYLKYKKLPVDLQNYKQWVICFVIGMVICAPFLVLYTGGNAVTGERQNLVLGIHNPLVLFKWIDIPADKYGLNPIFSSYPDNYLSYFTIILLLAGFVFLIVQRKTKDLAMLSMLAGIYIIFHLPMFGIMDNTFRIARYLAVESYVFCFLIVIGVWVIANSVKKYVKLPNLSLIMIVLLLLIVIFVQGTVAYDTLSKSYTGVMRITPAQYEVADWMRYNLPENASVANIGPLTYGESRFMQLFAERPFFWNDYNLTHILKPISGVGPDLNLKTTYIILDYSDLIAIGNQQQIQAMQQNEQQLANFTIVYNKNNIRVYKIG